MHRDKKNIKSECEFIGFKTDVKNAREHLPSQ